VTQQFVIKTKLLVLIRWNGLMVQLFTAIQFMLNELMHMIGKLLKIAEEEEGVAEAEEAAEEEAINLSI